ncbi:MAG: site-2 protease family protein [Haloarculaceae archaeon]
MRSFTLGDIWGIPIRINTSLIVFLPVLAWLIGSGGQIEIYAGFIETLTGVGFDLARLRAGSTPWVIGVAAAVGLFASVTVHELGHSWVALRYGLTIESITLWILGGMAALSAIPREWNREFWIAIAGPVTSVLLAAVCYVGLLVVPSSLVVPRFLFGWLAITNVTLAVFNLLPAFPMDGGRILRALLARRRPYASATRIAGRIGVIFAFVFAIVGVFTFQIILLLLAFFVYGAATTESRTVLLDELLTGITVGEIATRDVTAVPAATTVEELGERMLRERRTVYVVLGEGGSIVGVVSLDDLKQARKRDRGQDTAGAVMREVQRVTTDADAFDTLALLNQAGSTDALVEEDGAVVGVLSRSDYTRALTFQREFRSGLGG